MTQQQHFADSHLGYERWGRWAAPVPKPGELAAMQEGLSDLLDLLSWARPHGSNAEREWLDTWLSPRLDALPCDWETDGFGNVWAYVSKPSNTGLDILWSCHVDTVHSKGGRQHVRFADDGQTIELSKPKPGRCLGADDGAGVWLLLQMIAAQIPGAYVFHRGEECGRLGSEWIAKHTSERLARFDACVAFDRRDFADLISHQMGERCASELFVATLCDALNATGFGFSYQADDSGSFTDSYSYSGIIPECVNVSVGYDREHGPKETLDGLHLWRLAQAMVKADLTVLAAERDPTVIDIGVEYWGVGPDNLEPSEELLELVRRYPEAVAELLDLYGLGSDDILEHVPTGDLGTALGYAGGWHHD